MSESKTQASSAEALSLFSSGKVEGWTVFVSPARVWAWAPLACCLLPHSSDELWQGGISLEGHPGVSTLWEDTRAARGPRLPGQECGQLSSSMAWLNVTKRKPLQKGSSTSKAWREMSGWGQQGNPTGSPTEAPCARLCSSQPLPQSAGSPSSQCHALQPGKTPHSSGFQSPGFLQSASSCKHTRSRCQRAAQPLKCIWTSQMSRHTATPSCFLFFPSLGALPITSVFNKRQRGKGTRPGDCARQHKWQELVCHYPTKRAAGPGALTRSSSGVEQSAATASERERLAIGAPVTAGSRRTRAFAQLPPTDVLCGNCLSLSSCH